MTNTINKSDTTIKKPKRKRLTKDDIKIVIHGLPETPEAKKKFDQKNFASMAKLLIKYDLI